MNDKKLLLLDWLRKVHQLEYAHCSQSIFYRHLGKYIGIAAFILTTGIAFIYRFPIVENPCVKQFWLPFVSFAIALLTGYQTFIQPKEKSELHRRLGLDYEKLRHYGERIYSKDYTNTINQFDLDLIKFNEKWNLIDNLYVFECYYKKAKKKVKSFNKYPEELGFLSKRA